MSPDMAEAFAKRRAEIVQGVRQWEVMGRNPLSPRDHLALLDRAEELMAAADASDDMVDLASKALTEANNRLQGVMLERDALKALRTEALDAIRDGKAAMVQRDALLAALVKVEAEHDHTDNCDRASDWATKDTTCSCCMRDVEAAIAACRGGA